MIAYEDIRTEFIWLLIIAVATLIAVLAWKTTGRVPLDYDIFVVETQVLAARRILQVIHLGYEERSIAGVDLVRRMGAVRVLPRVEDLSIVIQSPSTIIESTSQALANRIATNYAHIEDIRIWQSEVLGEIGGDSWESTVMAAASAIAIYNGRNFVSTSNGQMFALRNVSNPPERGFETVVEESSAGSFSTAVPTPSDTPSPREEVGEMSRSCREGAAESDTSADSSPVNETRDTDEERVSLRLKFLDESEREVEMPLSSTVGELKRRHLSDITSAGRSIRLIYRGQLLREDTAWLRDVGVESGCVMHVLLGQPRAEGGVREESAVREAAAEPNNSGVEAGRPIENDTAMEADLENRVSETSQYIHAMFLLAFAFAEHLAGSWLGVTRWVRERAEEETGRREETATAAERERRTAGNAAFTRGGSRTGVVMQRVSRMLNSLQGLLIFQNGTPLIAPLLSAMLPVVFGVQLTCFWGFFLFFPRFFDRIAFLLLSMITAAFFAVCLWLAPMRIRFE